MCGYQAPNEGGVYNLLPSREKAELYPGDRGDIIDFSSAGPRRAVARDVVRPGRRFREQVSLDRRGSYGQAGAE